MNALIQGERGVSGTKIWFSVFAAVVCVKFGLAGVTVGGLSFGTFDATGAATLLGVFAATYAGRRYTEVKRKSAETGATP